MTLFLTIVFGCYLVAVIVLAFGWARALDETVPPAQSSRKIAVIVPFRNEAKALPALIQDMLAIDYPRDKVNFVFVDDHSSDNSTSVAHSAASGDSRFLILSLGDGIEGKKRAIAAAINQSDADVIVTTDADCRVGPKWLHPINSIFSTPAVRMAVGPVRLAGRGFFGRLQSMEFSSLVGTAGATLTFGVATMCNGANLAFLRSSFLEVGGYHQNESVTSGDDDFLMKKFAAKWKDGITFLNQSDGIVTAGASRSFGDFVNQRLRWAGKWRPAFNSSSLVAMVVLIFHMCNLLLIAGWLAGAISGKSFVILAGSKLFAEMIFLFPVCRFLGIRWSWFSFLLLQLFYSIYVVSIGLLSQILTTRWKGREVITRVWTGIS